MANPTLAKSIGPSNVPDEDNRDPAYPNRTVVIGATRPVTIVLTLAPQDTLTNGTGHVLVTETLPANQTFAGLVSLTPGAGVTLGGQPPTVAAVSGNTITFDLGDTVTNTNAGTPGTVTITYDALFTNGSGVNGTVLTSTTNLIYDGAAVDPASLTVVQHDPAVTESISDDSGGVLYSGRVITYTVALTNNGIVDAHDLVANALIPTGLTYVANSLAYVSGGSGPSTDAGATTDLKAGLTTLGPGQTATFQFQARVNPNLAAGTALTVRSTAAGSTYHSVPAAIGTGRTYTLAASDTDTVQVFTPTLFIVGEANGTPTTAPSNANPITGSANVTVGDIVRLHGAVNLSEGSNPSVVFDFALPTGLAFANDGTLAVALATPDGIAGGGLASSTLDPTGNTPGLQVATAINIATYQPTYFAIPASAIDTSVAGRLRVNLGTVSNNEGSPQPNAVVVEFNAIVANVAGNQAGTTLAQSLTVLGSTSNVVREVVREPVVAITKTVTAVNTATNTVTYRDVLTNTGAVTAYGVTLNDPQSTNVNPISGLTTSGTGSNLVIQSGNSTSALQATFDLAAGASQTFTYQVQVTDPAQPVPAVTATENYRDLKTPTVTLGGTTSGATGTATGGRDGVTTPPTLNDYSGSVSAALGVASGRVWQDLGNTSGTYDPLIDTPLGGVLVTARTAGPDGILNNADDLVQTTTTGADGSYRFALLPDGTFTITLPGSGANGLPASETLVYNAYGTAVTLPATASSSTNGTTRTGVDFAYQVANTAPTLRNLAVGTRTLTSGTAVALSNTGAATVTDAELDRLVAANEGYSYTGTRLVVQRYLDGTAAPRAADSFGGDGTLVFSGGTAALGGTTVGSFTQVGGVLSVTFNANAGASTVAGVLDHLTHTNGNANSFNLGLTIGATLADGNITYSPGPGGVQGTGGVRTSAPVLARFNLTPASASFAQTFVEPNNTAALGAAVAVDPGLTLADSLGAGATLSQATVAITGGFIAGEDQLAFTSAAGSGNIAGSYAAGVLTLTSAGNVATVTQWQAALNAARYYNNSDRPTTATRTLTIGITDRATGTTATAAAVSLAITSANDSPVLNTTVPVSLTAASERALAAPVGAVGTLVSDIAANSINVTDPDGAGASNGAALAQGGIAVVGAETARGSWWFSIDNGASWTRFAGAGIANAITGANALHLLGDASTRVYFQPTSSDFNGAIPVALQFRAWDRFDPVGNGALAPLPTDSALGSGINTAASSYSSEVRSLPQAVRAVNDAPIASGAAQLVSTAEDTASPPGATVTTLFGANFSDAADQQASGSNPTGSTANSLAGVAVVGNTTPAAQGVWRYSLDGGTTWITLPAGLSDGNALVLSASARLDFLPAADFNGAPRPLQVRLIDSSTDVAVSGTTTGAGLSASTQAIAGVDVSGTRQGGGTAVSAATVALSTSVTAVNDAPVAVGAAHLAAPPVGTASPPGETITALFGANFSDAADQQASGSNPTGSAANSLAGVAVVGNTTSAAQGVWRYSLDGGATWAALPAGLSDGNALALSASARLDFLPAANSDGTPQPLQARLIDSSADVPVSGTTTGAGLGASMQAIAGVDVSGMRQGGGSAVSAATVALTTSIRGGGGGAPLPGGQGGELFYGSQGADTLLGGQGDDSVFGGEGNDVLLGNQGADFVYGNQGEDLVYGNQGADTLFGGQGQDTLFGGQDADILYGNLGADMLFGNLGNDVLFGNQGEDLVYGNQGADALYGGQGADTLYGGQGDDVLVGGLGDDVLVGGLGADRYMFDANSGRDLILGFNQADGDRIALGGQTYTVSSAQNGDALLTLSGGGVVDLVGIRADQVNISYFAA